MNAAELALKLLRGDEEVTAVSGDITDCGLTIREEFASRALQGLLANSSVDIDVKNLARIAVDAANALLIRLYDENAEREE